MSIPYINCIVRCCRIKSHWATSKVSDIAESNVPALGRRERLCRAFSKEQPCCEEKFVCASVIVVLGLSVAMAVTFQANISKVENGKVTFTAKGTERAKSANR